MNTKPTTRPQVHPSLRAPETQVAALAQALFCTITADSKRDFLDYADLADKMAVGLTPTEIKAAKATAKRAAKVCGLL